MHLEETDHSVPIIDRITRVLSDEIASGELDATARVPSERQLAERFGVSRSSAREVLRSLQAAGLIRNRAKARAIVDRSTEQRFFEPLAGAAKLLLSKPGGPSDFQEARMLFECALARYAARNASADEITELRQAIEANHRAIGHQELFVATDAEFHAILARIPKNSLFAALSIAVGDWLDRQRSLGVRAPGADKIAHEHHRSVYQAIAARDAEGADAAMREHLSIGIRLIRQELEKELDVLKPAVRRRRRGRSPRPQA